MTAPLLSFTGSRDPGAAYRISGKVIREKRALWVWGPWGELRGKKKAGMHNRRNTQKGVTQPNSVGVRKS